MNLSVNNHNFKKYYPMMQKQKANSFSAEYQRLNRSSVFKLNSDDIKAIFFTGALRVNTDKNYLSAKNLIDDPYVLEFLNESNDNKEKELVVNAVNSALNKSSYLRFENYKGDKRYSYGAFDGFLAETCQTSVADIKNTGEIPKNIKRFLKYYGIKDENFIKDIDLDVKYGPMIKYFEMYMNDDFLNYLYENYYLKNIQKDIKVPKTVIEKCKKINRNYGAKVFLSADVNRISSTLDYINDEFEIWNKAGGKKVAYPSVINFSTADFMWYNDENPQKSDAAAAYVNELGYMAFCAPVYWVVGASVRHEMTHLNDYKKGENIRLTVPKGKSAIKYHFDVFKSRLFRDELMNAGLTEAAADYAYTNPEEFIAEASKGDMNKYSPELKQLLIDFGMPEWEFKLEKH